MSTPQSPSDRHSASSVRRTFIEFFEGREHTFVPSSAVVPQGDPTLFFTNAGMNQFKDVFLGTGKRDYTRAANTQKCIRASGKHNDLEDVGFDTYHHTFFEMLGNWSFGDYFKKDAIRWAWQLLTEVYGLPKERLWVTVFGGDEKDGLPVDTEAEDLWKNETDIDPSRILRFDRTDNFWEMGETGPCGPCSEIHIDRGAEGSNPEDGADPKIGVNAGNERFIELWNLVFMQFNRMDDGSLSPLPAQHVDTGMGFERILSILQGVSSNYDTDLFQPIFRRIEALTGKTYGPDESVNVAFRVVADHLRAVSTAVADGALPSNEGRGYVLRRMLRRAARFGRQNLGMEQPFLFEVVGTIVDVLGEAFPELVARREHLELIIRSEEESFGKTLDRGLILFERLTDGLVEGATLPGAEAFDLYATYGFPRDLVELMARERKLTLDAEAWDRAQEEHRDASRSDGMFKQLLSAEQLSSLQNTDSRFHEGGDEGHACGTRVQGFYQAEGRPDRLVLEASPFYPEGGGQVGDTGVIEASDGSFRFLVDDTQKVNDIVVHIGRAEGTAKTGLEVQARVDVQRRTKTRANHTATHLMHKALREVLGDHVTQQGSYVGPDRLRFDLSHPSGVSGAELEEIELRVNRAIAGNGGVETTLEELEAAKARGVMALFGEKYDQRVRVVDVGGWSTELCGGTHVRAAGDIGTFVIEKERALQAGVRRIEALTGEAALAHLQGQRRILQDAAKELKTGIDDVPSRIQGLKEQIREAKKKQKSGAAADLGAAFSGLKSALEEVEGVSLCVADLPTLDQAALRELVGRAKTLAPDLCCALFGRDGERVPFLVMCQGQALERGLQAGKLAGAMKAILGGGGGGKPDMAQGQGQRAGEVPTAIAELQKLARGSLA